LFFLNRRQEEWMKVNDPACGMTIEDTEAVTTSACRGKTYSFCSASCKEKFEKDPGSYAEE